MITKAASHGGLSYLESSSFTILTRSIPTRHVRQSIRELFCCGLSSVEMADRTTFACNEP